ncbi:MAG: hypothetical protein FJ304_07225 [Planctomycetes bacterium]|nr:hypothetical protein [Planctomycetota bacterium]
MIRLLAALVVLVAVARPAVAAPPADVADLFPPGTLAYAELHDPGALGPQLAALVKGTPLEDSIPFIDGKKAAAKTLGEFRAKRELAELALFLSPEVIGEFRKLGGVAVGLVGFNDRGEPEVAVAVLTGDSAAAGLAARAFITTSTNLRKVAEVSKVPVFQFRAPVVRYDPMGRPALDNEKPPTEGPHEPTFAYTPGLFVAGTSKAALVPVIKRFRGEEKDAIKATDGFKTAAAEYRKAGVFFYANAPELFAKLDAAARAAGDRVDSDLLAWLRLTAGPKALKAVAGHVGFRDGGLVVTVGTKLDPAQASPLAALLSGPAVKVEALHHARRLATLAATVNLPEKNRAAALVGFLDAFAKANGELGRLPGDVLKELQNKHKVAVNDVMAKVRAVTVIVPPKQELPKGAKPIPLFVLHFDDAAGATAWEELMPKLVAEIAGEEKPAQPSSEPTEGVAVRSLPGTGLPWKAAIHYARKDAIVAIGLERKPVALALTPDAAASVAKGLTAPAGDVVLLGAFNIGDLFALVPTPAGAKPGTFLEPPVDRLGEVLAPEEQVKDAEKARAAFLAAFGELPPAVLTARRAGDELRFELVQPKVQNGGLTPVINAGVQWFDKLMNLRDPNRFEHQHERRGRW